MHSDNKDDIYMKIADNALLNLMQPKTQSRLIIFPRYKDLLQLSNIKKVKSQIKTMKWEDIKNNKNICQVLNVALEKMEFTNNDLFTSDILWDIQYMDATLREWLNN